MSGRLNDDQLAQLRGIADTAPASLRDRRFNDYLTGLLDHIAEIQPEADDCREAVNAVWRAIDGTDETPLKAAIERALAIADVRTCGASVLDLNDPEVPR